MRSWSVFDAFVYSFFSVNLVTLGLYIVSQMYALEGGLLPALLLSAVIILAEVVVYAGLIAVMPRAGGDYVWQSRILGGPIGFVLAVTGWWFILWLWTPLYADMLRHTVVVPLLVAAGAREAAAWAAWSPAAWYLACLLTIAYVGWIIAIGMKAYARVQRICFWTGNIGLAAVCGLLLWAGPEGFRAGLEANAVRLLASDPGVYEATLAAGKAAGAVQPLWGGGIEAIFLAMPYLVFFNLWPNWGATLYGEVKGADDFKRNFWGMALGLLVTTALAVVLFLVLDRTVGWEFYTHANAAYWSYRWDLTTTAPPLALWPYPALLAVFTTQNQLLQFAVLLAMSAWFLGWAGTVFLSSTRAIFAAAFDRLLPEAVTRVDPRTRTPLGALALMVGPALVVSALFVWDVFGFRSLTLASTLVIAVTYLGSTVAAILLPYIRKPMFEASPIARYRVAGIPLITAAGVIFAGFLLYLLFQWLIDPHDLYGISYRNTASILFVLGLYALAGAIYQSARIYRRKAEKLDIDLLYREIPVE
ncbi:MAG: APC family permease [Armatimonadetes bacterium]|nr:APC family permease [Armatimonadota bacterium]